jgi:hypothetical protein
VKVKTLVVAAGVSSPLILSGSVDAGYVGLTTADQPNPFGILVTNVYAEFDNPGDDWMQAVAGTPMAPLSLTVVGGTFWNHANGGDTAPTTESIGAFPSIAFDSFYTIGMKSVAPGVEDLTELVNMPPLTGSQISTTNSSWALIPPNSAQGNPFDPVHSFPGNGRILIGQFSTTNGSKIVGSFLMQFVSDGVVTAVVGSFPDSACAGDCAFPFDDHVDVTDLLALLAQWGTINECDFDGGGVGTSDFLILIANWGPCF